MKLCLARYWLWLVDALNAYSCYLVHSEVLLTARGEVVRLAGQRALKTLDGRLRLPVEPVIMHNRGPLLLARECRAFVHREGMTDLETMACHP